MNGLIFDFDGLMIDTEMPEFQAWSEIYREMGFQLPFNEWVKCIGTSFNAFDPVIYLERLTGSSIEGQALKIRQEEISHSISSQQPLLPGIKDYLEFARRQDIKVGLASSSSRKWVMDHLERRSIVHYFDCICTREDVLRVKPEPDLYIAALECMGLEAKNAIAFEDSPNGIQAAKAAGLFCVAIPNQLTARLDINSADLILNNLSDMPLEEMLEHFFALSNPGEV